MKREGHSEAEVPRARLEPAEHETEAGMSEHDVDQSHREPSSNVVIGRGIKILGETMVPGGCRVPSDTRSAPPFRLSLRSRGH